MTPYNGEPPNGEPSNGKPPNGGSPHLNPTSPAPSLPATTTDLGRFPERSETGEITSFLAPPGSSSITPGGTDGASDEKLPGDIDPQIEILGRIGAGGMGEVFLGRQKHLGRRVAVKRIRHWGADAATRERFIHEAKAQSRLRHPGIAQVYDLRESGGALYLVMEHVEGRTLEEILETEGKRPPAEIVSIGLQLTEALEAAAHEGYIHRDLKPANVMLTAEGSLKIIDFGLALRLRGILQGPRGEDAAITDQERFTRKGELLGTPAYMSPEQLSEVDDLDIRCDIWSLGVLLYTLATGEPPFTGRDFVCTVKNVFLNDPVPLTTLEAGFPERLWQAIAKALRKDRTERWQDYPAFREALLDALPASAESSPRDVPAQGDRDAARPSPSGRRRLRSALTISSLLGLILAAAWLLGGPSGSAPDVKLPTGIEAGTPEAGKVAGVAGESRTTASTPELSPPPSAGVPPSPVPPEPYNGKPHNGEPSAPKAPPAAEGPAALASTPASVPLREKLARHAPSDEDVAFLREVLAVVDRQRPRLLAKDFNSATEDLQALSRRHPGLAGNEAPPPALEYRALQLRGALRMLEVAQGSIRAAGAPPTAELAVRALSGNAAGALGDLEELSGRREELLFFLPLALRSARLDLQEAAQGLAVARLAAKCISTGGASPAALEQDLHYVRALATAAALEAGKAGILRTFSHLASEFEAAAKEMEALQALLRGKLDRALAVGRGTAAFPAAAELLLRGFEAQLAAGSLELQGRTGWHAYGWKLFPPEASLREKERHWDLDSDGNGSILRAEDLERRLVMGSRTTAGGAAGAAEGGATGVRLVFRFEPRDPSDPEAYWQVLLRGADGASNALRFRFKENACTLVGTRLDPAAPDLELARALLPEAAKGDARDRTLVLVPLGDRLHVYLDREHVLGVPLAAAGLPQQLSIGVARATLQLRSIQVKAARGAEKEDR